MTKIINEKLRKCCDNCHSLLDKPCAWLSLGNEYCTEIMEADKEIERLNNKIEELELDLQDTNSQLADVSKRCIEAIEYIETHQLYEQDYDYDYEENLTEYPPDDTRARKDLLEILKGEDKNE